jgi:mannitol/fructose-specific phosphotransferase system IIA component (Ntr-type)
MPKVLDDCVEKLLKQGKSKERAFAICTKQLQKAGILKKGTRKLAKRKG